MPLILAALDCECRPLEGQSKIRTNGYDRRSGRRTVARFLFRQARRRPSPARRRAPRAPRRTPDPAAPPRAAAAALGPWRRGSPWFFWAALLALCCVLRARACAAWRLVLRVCSLATRAVCAVALISLPLASPARESGARLLLATRLWTALRGTVRTLSTCPAARCSRNRCATARVRAAQPAAARVRAAQPLTKAPRREMGLDATPATALRIPATALRIPATVLRTPATRASNARDREGERRRTPATATALRTPATATALRTPATATARKYGRTPRRAPNSNALRDGSHLLASFRRSRERALAAEAAREGAEPARKPTSRGLRDARTWSRRPRRRFGRNSRPNSRGSSARLHQTPPAP